MTPKRRRCVVCRCLTEKWQRVNFGPYHCYDDCKSTQAKYLHYRVGPTRSV